MAINEDLKKNVNKKSKKLALLTELLKKEQIKINVILGWLYLMIFISVIAILNYYGENMELYMLLMLLPLLLILFIILRLELKNIKKRYDRIYNESLSIMNELSELTEWSKLRKRYILVDKEYSDMLIIRNYVVLVENKIGPYRSIINYYKILNTISLIMFFSILIILLIETLRYLYIV